MLSPNFQDRKPSYLDDLRSVLTPNSGGNRSFTKLSRKYREQQLSLTPLADRLTVLKHCDQSLGKENGSFIDKNLKTADLPNTNTSATMCGDDAGKTEKTHCTFATKEELKYLETINNCVVNPINSCIGRALDYSLAESPGVLDKAVTSIMWSDSDSEEDSQTCKNGRSVIIISDSDEPRGTEKVELSRLVSTTSNASESSEATSNVAFLSTPSNGPQSVKLPSTASASSSKKLQLLRSIIISSSEEDNGSSPLSLIERISKPKIKKPQSRKPTKPKVPDRSQTAWALREPQPAIDSSDEDDAVFEQFLEKCKTPQQAPHVCLEHNSKKFIISDSDESRNSSSDDMVYLVRSDLPATGKPKPTTKTRNRENEFAKPRPVRVRSLAKSPERPKFKQPPQMANLTRSLPHLPHHVTGQSTETRFSFVVSLGVNIDPLMRDSRAAGFVKDYKKLKTELVTELYSVFNERIFENKLPKDMLITWNPRLTATAGYCYTKKELSGVRTARLELSSKVLDSAERLRDTLVHELCHAATWLINGVRDGHGRYWKAWARLAQIKFPGLPPVSRCHSYHVQTKYTYQCTVCSYRIGRHSKSLDINKKVCGRCRGKFEILVNNTPSKSPKTPSRFALFVKDNYVQVKKNNNLKAHADVMRSLSEEFAAKNKIV